MQNCPSCSCSVSGDAQTCPSCGAALVDSATPTRNQTDTQGMAPQHSEYRTNLHGGETNRPEHSPEHGPKHSSASGEVTFGARFVAGVVLAGRYRIVGLLGKGGMGEVYKAEDLKLDQMVALKFLPPSIALDGAAQARFHNEVRTARQISHPNVCRVYDIGELPPERGGLHFLSMEFIDGEDLSSLLRRIGRLPGDKAVELARQMCAGLQAAHDNGVLHRDLKPANVMIDGRGRARITDFGLAVVSEELRGEEAKAGTPAYMAPEQLTGKEATPRSDVYALGLVLYELFTGKRVFEASSIDELIELHLRSAPPTPSSRVSEIDPIVERVILQCLEKDPRARPASAMQVGLALPGGDPLQAALARGETPSPEMVAAAGEKTGLRPAAAVALLAAVVIGLFLALWISGKVNLVERTPIDPPDALSRRAREIGARLGYTATPADSFAVYDYDTAYLNYLVKNDPSPTRWDRMQFPAVIFIYNESPSYFQFIRDPFIFRLSPSPPLSGIVTVTLDPQGRLLRFKADPPPTYDTEQTRPANDQPSPKQADWSVLFDSAGLDLARFTPTEPRLTPPTAFDAHKAWTGSSAGDSSVPLRIEAASWRGKPVLFFMQYPWTRSGNLAQQPLPEQPAFIVILILVVLIGASLLAWSNYKRSRGDRHGAFKLSCVIFVLSLLSGIFLAHHAPTVRGLGNDTLRQLPVHLFWSTLVWICYFAFEPLVRRYWPTSIISWSRILAGRMRDPLVGHDVLIGVLTIRFGLVALTCTILASGLLSVFPLTLNFSLWYAGTGLIGPLAVLALGVYGFQISLGGQKVFQGSLLED